MLYDVYIQDKFIITLEKNNTGDVISYISNQINSGEIQIDQTKDHNIRIEPKKTES